MHYNGSNSFLFVNAKKIYQFKARDSEIKNSPCVPGNISEDVLVNNMKKKNRIKWVYVRFSVGFRAFNICNIIDIHKHLMKKT